MKRLKLKANTLRNIEGSLFMAPWIIGFLAFAAYPLIFSFVMSLHQVTLRVSGLEMSFRGFSHYSEILTRNPVLLYDELFPFLQRVLMMIPIIVIFSLTIAILLNQKFPGRSFFRAIFFVPVILSAGDVISQLIFQGQGTLTFLEKFNLESFVGTYIPDAWAGPLLEILESFVLILWYSGVEILIFLAGRQTISSAVYEAARIDGASPWESFWKITLPAMTPFILLNLIYCVVDLFTYPDNPLIARVINNQYDGYGLNSALVWVYFSIILIFLGLIFAVYGWATRNSQSEAG